MVSLVPTASVVDTVAAPTRIAGTPIAIAGDDVALLLGGLPVTEVTIVAFDDTVRSLDAGHAIASLAGRGDVLLIGIDDDGDRGVVPAYRTKGSFALAPSGTDQILGFRAAPETLAVGLARTDVGERAITLNGAAAPLDDACLQNAGGIVVGQLVHEIDAGVGAIGAGFDVHRIVDAWDPVPNGQLGRSLALTDKRIVTSMGPTGVMVARDDRSDIVVEAVLDIAHDVVALARGQIIIVNDEGFFAAPLPTD